MTYVCHAIVIMITFDIPVGDIMTGSACGAGNAYPSGAHDFTSGFYRGSCHPVICLPISRKTIT